jgi:hypothetical protein
MIRREQIHPNEQGEVTLEMLIAAATRACVVVDLAGGAFSLVTERAPTGFPGEMYTVKAGIEWKHDVRVSPRPEQFEQATQAESYSSQPHLDEQARRMAEVAAEHDAEVVAAVKGGAEIRVEAGSIRPDIDPVDGFDYSKLDEEDVEEPVAAS